MIVYILSTFFNALSGILAIYWLQNGFFPGYTRDDIPTILLHCNTNFFFFFIILYSFLKLKNRTHFNMKKSFTNRDEIKQMLFFSITMLGACYKGVILGFVQVSHFSVTSMMRPIVGWMLAVIFLKERFDKRAVKFAVMALIGFGIIHFNKIGIASNEVFYLGSYILIASVGDVIRRSFCRKRSEDMQALFLECFNFSLYSVCILILSQKFSWQLLFSPGIFVVSLTAFLYHFGVVYGVRKASNIASIEFANFSKTIFELSLSAVLLGEYLNRPQIIGGIFIVIAILGMNHLERLAKQQ